MFQGTRSLHQRLPWHCRWYAKTIGSGSTAINLVVAHTSVFIDGYLTNGSSYAVVDEEIAYVRHAHN